MDGYCEKHDCAWVIKRGAGTWIYECPKCRVEGLLDTITTDHTEMKPKSEWTISNSTEVNLCNGRNW